MFTGWGSPVGALQTLGFVVIVFGNQATTYTNRERRHLWSSRPSSWLLISSVADLLIASTLAVRGIAMTPLPAWLVAGTLAAAAAFAIILDFESAGFPTPQDHLAYSLSAKEMTMGDDLAIDNAFRALTRNDG